MRDTVFVHTNHRQVIGAHVACHAVRRNSRNSDKFEIAIIHTKDHPFLAAQEGRTFQRGGVQRTWHMEDLQSFTPLRFKPPELMGYEGRAVIIDPDIFAIADVHELLSRDMQGKAIVCRSRGSRPTLDGCMATSVMLLDCARLEHWQCEQQFNELFALERDYKDWICLHDESRETIGLFENEWNDFDRLTTATKMVHNTKRKTQPWKSGLPVDYVPAENLRRFPPYGWMMRLRRQFFGDYGLLGHYRSHPDRNQEQLFFGLLRECLDDGTVTEDMLRAEMRQNHVRHDAFEVIDRTPPLAAA